jgi:hypothetical protein
MPFFKTRFDRPFGLSTQAEYLLTQSSSSSAARCIPFGLLSADNADFRLYELLKSNSRFFRIADENSLAFRPSCLRQRRFSSSRELLHHLKHWTNHGGGWRDRTDDPLLAKQVLSQLS